jgi:hypothetical protein
MIPRSQIASQYTSFNAIYITNYVNDVTQFKFANIDPKFLQGEFFCDRFNFVYNLPFNPYGKSNP